MCILELIFGRPVLYWNRAGVPMRCPLLNINVAGEKSVGVIPFTLKTCLDNARNSYTSFERE